MHGALIFRKIKNQLLSVCISTSKVEFIVDLDYDSSEYYFFNNSHALRSVSDHPANNTFTVLLPEATIEGSVISWRILWDDLLSVVSVEGSNCPLGLKPHANRDIDMVHGVSDSMPSRVGER